MPVRRFLFLVPAIVILFAVAEGLHADTFQFSYTSSGNSVLQGAISGSGMLTTAPESGGSFLITSISGTQNGSPISLLPANSFKRNDNLLFPSAPFLDIGGMSFFASGVYENLLWNGQNYSLIVATTVSGDPSASSVTTFSVNGVPEPATLILLGSGIFACAAAWHRKRIR